MFEFEFDPSESDRKSPGRIIGEGKAHFTVAMMEKCISKAGNPQLKGTFRATDEFGITNTMFDYFPSLAKFKDKLKGLLAGCGMHHLYNDSGKFDEKLLIGCTGTIEVKHETHETYGLQPKIKFYYEKNGQPKAANVKSSLPNKVEPQKTENDWDSLGDDEIPF